MTTVCSSFASSASSAVNAFKVCLPTLRILSAGAAQAVTERIIEAFRRDTGNDVVADFGAVGAMKARVDRAASRSTSSSSRSR